MRLLPFFVEAAADAVGRGLQDQFAVRRQRRAQARRESPPDRRASAPAPSSAGSARSVPRPALRSPADTTRYCESKFGKTICRTLAREFSAALRAALPAANRESGARCGRSLRPPPACAPPAASASRLGDGLQKKARRGPGGQAHLTRLQHNVALAAALFESALRRIGAERLGEP